MRNILAFLTVIILSISCNNNTESNNDLAIDDKEHITRLDNNEVTFKHNFPEILTSGDTLSAEIESQNSDWKIIAAYVNCPVDEDGQFKIQHRFDIECLQLPVENNNVLIQFFTVGQVQKSFYPLTLIS